MRTIDLNADLGEGMPWDFPLLDRISSANVSCGAHAGTDAEIVATLSQSVTRGVVIGAHPSWPDRAGFGRIEHDATSDEVVELIITQVNHLKALAAPLGVQIRYLKPHGALYNQAMRGPGPIMMGVLQAAKTLGLPLMGQPGTDLERKALELSVPYVTEGFPDRRYGADLRLLPRTAPDALITDRDEALAQAVSLINRGVMSLCLHGDSPHAVDFADALTEGLKSRQIEICSFLEPDRPHVP
jgi:UPF0271 protein